MTTSTHKSLFRVIDLRCGGRGLCGVHGRFDIAVTTTAKRLALYRGFVARAAFDRGSIENARITSSADRRERVFPHVLRDDRRFDGPKSRRMC